MGLEWHNRKRNERGQFAPHKHTTQVHIYCTEQEWRTIRAGAMIARRDMSSFCREAAMSNALQLKRGSEPVVLVAGLMEEQGTGDG